MCGGRAAAFEIWDPPRRDQAGGLALVLVAPDPRGHAACVIQESYMKHLVRRNAFTHVHHPDSAVVAGYHG